MKIRSGFVSNSSSSSFVIVKKNKLDFETFDHKDEVLRVGSDLGETEFGWSPEYYYDAGSKINFAYLQTVYGGERGIAWREMLEKIIKEYTGASKIEYLINDKWNDPNWGYIDHQSNAAEHENTEIFDDEETLKNFLFNSKSFIHTDNDNH